MSADTQRDAVITNGIERLGRPALMSLCRAQVDALRDLSAEVAELRVELDEAAAARARFRAVVEHQRIRIRGLEARVRELRKAAGR